MMGICKFYGVSGYVIGAKLDSVRQQVLRSPSTAPQGPAWFAAVVEAHCKRLGQRREPRVCAPRPPIRPPQYPPEDYCPEFTAGLMRDLLTSGIVANNREKGVAA